jgi:hypothetical protein
MTSISLLRGGATALAGVLLTLQVVGGLEYTEGGTLYTRASMIAAMVTLAALPVFIEAARREGKPAIAVALFVAFCSFLAYSLPANVGRTGELKAAKVAEAASVERAKVELSNVKALLADARAAMAKECATGLGTKCLGRRSTVTALEDRQSRAEADVRKGEVTAHGDLGSETISWAVLGQLSPETVRKGSVVAFAAGLDIVIWALVWFACATAERKEKPTAKASGSDDEGERRPEPKREAPKFPRPVLVSSSVRELPDHELEALRLAFAVGDGPLTNNELAARMSVVKSEASKRVAKGVAAGIVSKHRVGKEVAISLN